MKLLFTIFAIVMVLSVSADTVEEKSYFDAKKSVAEVGKKILDSLQKDMAAKVDKRQRKLDGFTSALDKLTREAQTKLIDQVEAWEEGGVDEDGNSTVQDKEKEPKGFDKLVKKIEGMIEEHLLTDITHGTLDGEEDKPNCQADVKALLEDPVEKNKVKTVENSAKDSSKKFDTKKIAADVGKEILDSLQKNIAAKIIKRQKSLDEFTSEVDKVMREAKIKLLDEVDFDEEVDKMNSKAKDPHKKGPWTRRRRFGK